MLEERLLRGIVEQRLNNSRMEITVKQGASHFALSTNVTWGEEIKENEMGSMQNKSIHASMLENLEERNLNIDERIILKWILKK
jgi:hypothetical protein